MTSGEATEMQQGEVQKVEIGDAIMFECDCTMCQISGDPTRLKAIVMDATTDGKLTVSPDGETTVEATLDADRLNIPSAGKSYKVVSVEKGEGSKEIAIRKEYAQLKEKHLAADIGEEEFSKIADNTDKRVKLLMAMTMTDNEIISDRYLATSMILELVGIQATKEQVVRASMLMADGGPSAEEALLSALMRRSSQLVVPDPITTAMMSGPGGPRM